MRDDAGRDRLQPECMTCLAGKYPDLYPADAPGDRIMEYVRGCLSIIAEASPDLAAPVLVRDMNDLHEKLFGDRIAYTEEKSYYNQLMLRQEDWLWEEIKKAEDPLEKALQFAIIGNYIDLSAFRKIDEAYLRESMRETDRFPLQQVAYQNLKRDLKQAKKLVLLADNCGEILVDKLLLSLIREQYPGIDMTVIVKGYPVQNDATTEDAGECGLTEQFRVLPNGNDIAGTWLPELSGEARGALEEADLILSKGQANLETLRGVGWNIYYIFMCKCHMLSREYGVPKMTGMLLQEKDSWGRKG